MDPDLGSQSQNAAPPPPGLAKAVTVLVCGLLTTWLAGGSLGWIAPPLQRTLTWLALGTIIFMVLGGGHPVLRVGAAGHPLASRVGGKAGFWAEHASWAPLAAAVLAILMTASGLAVVNILAVSVLLATVAAVRPGAMAAAAGPAALAAAALAVFRLVCEATASGWALADAAGSAEGHWAALLTGRPLLIGASFGGIDFLVVMAALTVAMARLVPQDTSRTSTYKRAVAALLAIAAAQTVYLVVLAFTHDLAALLPPPSRPLITPAARMGVWTWSDAVRTMLPWRLPVLAAIVQTAVAVLIFRLMAWPAAAAEPAAEVAGTPAATRRRDRRITGNSADPSEKVRPQPAWLRFAPAGLLVVAAAAATLAPVKPDLTGRRIVAYDDGSLDWTTTDPGNVAPGLAPRFGLLPALVASLGGQFSVSKDLRASDLRDADVLIVLPPGASSKPGGGVPNEICQTIWNFAGAGGGLIVAGEPESGPGAGDNGLDELLAPTAMSFRDDTANSLTERWECNLLAAPGAATVTSRPGRSSFGFDRAASVRAAWPAAPLLVGRWCWNELGSDPTRLEAESNPPRLAALPYAPGGRLGDLVLAAQQNFGRGRVVALGDATCLSNDGIPFSYTFCGPLLAALAQKDVSPLAWWRQLTALAAAAAAVAFLFYRFEPLRLIIAAIALALAVIGCNEVNDATATLLPATANQRPLIYVDGSHLEAMGKDPWREDGVGRFMRVLAESDYLPLLAPDLAVARLKGARMLVSIAPGRAPGEDEIAAVNDFVQQGGIFLCTAGAPDAAPSRPLLDNFNLQIADMPLPPWINARQTEPLGAVTHGFRVPAAVARLPSGQNQIVQFHAAWPVSPAAGTTWPNDDPAHGPVLAGNSSGQGQTFLLGDTAFALNEGLMPPVAADDPNPPQNALFWRATLRSWLTRTGE